jgi:hypothetical protein
MYLRSNYCNPCIVTGMSPFFTTQMQAKTIKNIAPQGCPDKHYLSTITLAPVAALQNYTEATQLCIIRIGIEIGGLW